MFESLLSVLLGIYAVLKLVEHMIILCLSSWGITKLFHSAAPFDIPSSNAQGFQFLHILVHTCYFLCVCVLGWGELFFRFILFLVLVFNNSHPNRYKLVYHCGFDCISWMISVGDHLFICLFPICVASLEKYLFRPLPNFKLVGLFCCCIVGVPYIFWILIFNILRISFSHSVSYLFTLLIVSFGSQKFFMLM